MWSKLVGGVSLSLETSEDQWLIDSERAERAGVTGWGLGAQLLQQLL